MLFNHERALQTMDRYGLDALVAAAPRNVYYASGFWTRISEWGFQENQAAVIVPRDPAKPAILIVPGIRARWLAGNTDVDTAESAPRSS